jgi:hypothetical protein
MRPLREQAAVTGVTSSLDHGKSRLPCLELRAKFRTDPERFTDYMRRDAVEWKLARRAQAAE